MHLSGIGTESGWRTWVMATKAEAAYPRTEILDRYLNRADYGLGPGESAYRTGPGAPWAAEPS